jgi:hypothetical protein
MTRLYGRAPIGERLYDTESPGDCGKNISLIGGISIDATHDEYRVVALWSDARYHERQY